MPRDMCQLFLKCRPDEEYYNEFGHNPQQTMNEWMNEFT